MKHSTRILLFLAAFVLLLTVCAAAAAAVPARPDVDAGAGCRSHTGTLLPPEKIAAHPASAYGSKAPALDPADHDLPLAVIVIGFPNMPYDADFDWSAEIFAGDRSLQSYYSDMSLGAFTFVPVAETSACGVLDNRNTADAENDGVIHVTVSTDHLDWRLEKESSAVYLPLMTMFAEALEQASAVMDFAAYDANGDGVITTDELAIAFVVGGYEAAASAAFEQGYDKYLWSHSWSIAEAIENYRWKMEPPKPDGVSVSSYIAIAEYMEEGVQEPICVLAHELGHYLGLEDFYDTTYYYLGEWSAYDPAVTSLMCSAWGEDADGNFLPPPIDAYNRYLLHWYTPQKAEGNGVYTVTAQDYDAETPAFSALLIPTRHDGEFYLIENRQPTKWDIVLPTAYPFAPEGLGLLIWHVDENYYDYYADSNLINASVHHPTLTLLFPEETENGVTFFGDSGNVVFGRPFWNRDLWNETISETDGFTELPLYGIGLKRDLRSARLLSGLQLRICSDSAAEMEVELATVDHDYCPYCEQVHGNSFGERFTAFFHRLFARIRGIFSRKQATALPPQTPARLPDPPAGF
ncbi:MAG: immune inhibitor A [Clostridia bacterium]|nr:immune inhibitor A [Clostridia bacterium]